MRSASSQRVRRVPGLRRDALRRSRPAVLLSAMALALLVAPPALADSARSSNWAGYAAHGSHVSFHRVFGAWRQPAATCTAGTPTYSSVWVGLGGFSPASPALEQIGSEVDCRASGQVVSSVWYELVPAASRNIGMTVAPGDYLTAAVTVSGHDVRLQIDDVTRRTSFQRTLHTNLLDVSSAEWIVEAPSQCSGTASCQELALANFGSARFSRATAVSPGGYQGSIADRRWSTTKIILAAKGHRFIANPPTAATASPSTLTAGGSAFTVTYASSPSTGTPAATASSRTASVLARPRRS